MYVSVFVFWQSGPITRLTHLTGGPNKRNPLHYANSPNKSRELAEIVTDLNEVFAFPDSGDAPIGSQGSRWIAHKRKALQ